MVPVPRRLGILVAVAALLAVVACTPTPGPSTTDGPILTGSGTLRVLAGSSLVDLQDILDEVRRATGVTVQLSFTGTLDGVKAIRDGNAGKSYDAAWLDTSRYFALMTNGRKVVDTSTTIMTSPVVIGVRESVAHSLGWDTHRPTWGDFADAAAAHRLGFAMTNPAASNSGFCALVGMATALSGGAAATGDTPAKPLTTDQVRAVAPRLRALFTAQQLTAGSSGWLADAYVKRARDGQAIDALINYESVLLELNAGGQLPEPLKIIYPTDGDITAEYPLSLLSSASAQARTNYRAVTAYLLRPQVQREIMEKTHRRPVSPSVALDDVFRTPAVPELPFPDRLEVIDSLTAAYSNTLRRPARTIYVLDTSGSMKGDRLAGLKAALLDLTGANPSADDALLGFQQREEVVLLPFSTTVSPPQRFDVPVGAPQSTLDGIGRAVRGLSAAGDTALYEALVRAYAVAAEPAADDPYTTIVLLTDGERTVGRTLDDFRAYYAQLPQPARQVPVFPLLFGENSEADMLALAQLTGGRAFDARTGALADAFREIRGYQ
jgi:Ca-activated chloride channel family protein